MPLSGQPKRFSFHMETNDRTTQVTPRNTISHRLKAMIARWGGTGEIYAVLESLIEGCFTGLPASFGRPARWASTEFSLILASFQAINPFRMWSGWKPRVSQMFERVERLAFFV